MILADSRAGCGASQVKSQVDLLNIHVRQVQSIRKKGPSTAISQHCATKLNPQQQPIHRHA